EKIVRFLFPGDFFGQFALLQEKKHDAHAEVLDAATVCIIHKQDFLPIIENNSKMAYSFVIAISELLHQAEEWISTISLLETEQRLAKLLLLFHEKNGSLPSFTLPVPKKELAALLGTTPETLSRKLASLEKQGLISFMRKNVTIHDLAGLKAISY
ncbi:MAG: Crp/Fnr family transcriptional regulator, partial [Gorillibacterium sp.]|nr:Crp/Fnr family transcriptional regulator [Gorillibacterium sp.]